MAEESRYRSPLGMAYARSSRSSRRASVPWVVTGPFGGARSRRSPSGGLARPEGDLLSEGGPGLINWAKHGHGLAALGHLEALAPLHPAQVPGEVLAKRSYAHSLGSHVYTHCSILGQTLAPLSRSEATSTNLRRPVSSENEPTALRSHELITQRSQVQILPPRREKPQVIAYMGGSSTREPPMSLAELLSERILGDSAISGSSRRHFV